MSRPELNCRINTPRLHELRKKRRKSALAARAELAEASSPKQNDKQCHAAAKKRLNSKVRAYSYVLAARHPSVFNKEAPVPLKIGIRADLRRAHPKFTNKVNNLFLNRWCNQARYISTLVPGSPRYDLNGDVSGDVLEAEVVHLK